MAESQFQWEPIGARNLLELPSLGNQGLHSTSVWRQASILWRETKNPWTLNKCWSKVEKWGGFPADLPASKYLPASIGPGGHSVQICHCYAWCPNPRAEREKASKTMQLAKKGKFIADSSQGSRRVSNAVVRGQRALSPSSTPNL